MDIESHDVTTVYDAIHGKTSYIYSIDVGRWQDVHGAEVPIQVRLIAFSSTEPGQHQHPFSVPSGSQRLDFDDGCAIEVRVAEWR